MKVHAGSSPVIRIRLEAEKTQLFILVFWEVRLEMELEKLLESIIW